MAIPAVDKSSLLPEILKTVLVKLVVELCRFSVRLDIVMVSVLKVHVWQVRFCVMVISPSLKVQVPQVPA